jgi:hypothetical protein
VAVLLLGLACGCFPGLVYTGFCVSGPLRYPLAFLFDSVFGVVYALLGGYDLPGYFLVLPFWILWWAVLVLWIRRSIALGRRPQGQQLGLPRAVRWRWLLTPLLVAALLVLLYADVPLRLAFLAHKAGLEAQVQSPARPDRIDYMAALRWQYPPGVGGGSVGLYRILGCSSDTAITCQGAVHLYGFRRGSGLDPHRGGSLDLGDGWYAFQILDPQGDWD